MGHGNRWEAIIGDAEEAIGRFIPMALAKGDIIGTSADFPFEHPDGTTRDEHITGILYPDDTPLGFLVLVCSDSTKATKASFLYSGYPFLRDGCSNTLKILNVTECCNPHEVMVKGDLDGVAEVWFTDPLFFIGEKRPAIGDSVEFSVAGLAYALRETTTDVIVVDSGPLIDLERERLLKEDPTADPDSVKSVEVSLKGSCWLMPCEPPEDGEFRGVVENVVFLEVCGIDFCRLEITLIRTDDMVYRVAVFASESVLGDYKPDIGDSIEGAMWVQGYPTGRIV